MSAVPSVLIADDDAPFAAAAAQLADAYGCIIERASCAPRAHEQLYRRRWRAALLAVELYDGGGLCLANEAVEQCERVVTLARAETLYTTARAVHLSLREHWVKPVDAGALDRLFAWAAGTDKPEARVRPLPGLIGQSPPLHEVAHTLARVAASDVTVLLAGETGTGKEAAARALHEASGRQGPFVAVNCGALEAQLLHSQLFGHERGSFTGAVNRHRGYFEQAAGGTLLLDEITEMPAELQVYLLRVLETRQFTRLGGTELLETDARIVAATNRSPLAAVEDGLLREDLYFRLAEVELTLPPLRERGDDVLLLAEAFRSRLEKYYGISRTFAPGTEQVLLSHSWPGNVRELKNVVRRAWHLSTGTLDVQPHPARPLPASVQPNQIVVQPGMSFDEIRQRVLDLNLAAYQGDRTQTAHALGISVRTVHNLLKARKSHSSKLHRP